MLSSGRNQQLESEVNVSYCRERSSDVSPEGGGGWYMPTSRMSCCRSSRPEDNVGFAFNRFVNMVLLLVLRKMGVEAVGTIRNDILRWRPRVCGTASICRGAASYTTHVAVCHWVSSSASPLSVYCSLSHKWYSWMNQPLPWTRIWRLIPTIP